ncbi:MAG: phosphoribosylamine--glycine ligase, partial [Alphaproteobacteria bacterium]|nr:phosphoribosylamine--glycine ligase [Alphaproteobacteria bacterium]
PAGVRLTWGSDVKRQNDSFGALGGALLISFILVYLVMVALYDSFLYPFVVLFSIPVAVIGAFLALNLSLSSLSLFTLLGLIIAAGPGAKNAILIVEFAKDLHKEGKSIREAALEAARDMLAGESFGSAGAEIVVEQYLDGEELSYFALADGKTMLPLSSAQDHKRAFDGDQGPNTGGMGAYSPAHLMNAELEEKIIHRLIKPTVEGMKAEGCPFTGVLFAGIMVVKGEPYLIEYNARFGDPECQTLMLRLQGDLLQILLAGAEGRLKDIRGQVSWSEHPSMCVVMAANGYPGDYRKGTVIKGLVDADEIDHVMVFHAGTKKGANGAIEAHGGRVLGICATGENLGHAKRLCYEAVEKIDWPEGFCRKDIGWRALQK